MIAVGLRPLTKIDCFSGGEAALKTALACLERPPGVVFGSEAILKTALARLEQPLRVSFWRNRDRVKRASSSPGDAATGAGSARAAATRMDTARVLEGGRREGGHSVDCIDLPRRASV